jgi:hypothetical protein
MMWKDEIVEEVRRARAALVARYRGDLAALSRDLNRMARESGRQLIPSPTATPGRETEGISRKKPEKPGS